MLTKFGFGFHHRKNAVKTAFIPSTLENWFAICCEYIGNVYYAKKC